MLIKQGVDISRLSPDIRHILRLADKVLREDSDEIVITSTYEGNHMASSYHYSNEAFDFTGRYDLTPEWADDLRAITKLYIDVVWESDHIHVEFDRWKYNKQQEKQS